MKRTALLLLALSACNDDSDSLFVQNDSGASDAAAPTDASTIDASVMDAATSLDAARVDAAESDASLPGADSAVEDSAVADATVDAATCQPTVLLRGGLDVTTQGWTVIQQQPSTLTYSTDTTLLQTSTAQGAASGGQLLLSLANAVPVGQPFKLEVVLRVDAVNPHNPLDSAAAILGSLTGNLGNPSDRAQMIYLDAASIGWSDNAQSAAVAVQDGNPHTYVLEVDAQNSAHVSVDGVEKLTRANFVTTGTIAIGDQTNDTNVDSSLRITSVSRLCL